ncbi:MAG: AIR synthase family protein [Clostridia bacterium]|nr:AIR synthase family protein [Clostridia bacterium]
MRVGKLTNEQLDRLILSKLRHNRQEVIMAPGIGVDCTAVDIRDRLTVLSCDPITAAQTRIGSLSVNVCCNDAAASGAEPIGLMVTLLLPPTVTEQEISDLMDELIEAANNANVDVIGGHTEITNAVTRIVTCTTVIAREGRNGTISPRGMREGDYLIMTKHAGLEGANIIADYLENVSDILTEEEIAAAHSFAANTNVVREGMYAADHGATAMHDATEGGVLGAAWELSDASGIGLIIDKSAITVHPVTEKLCTAAGVDPLRLISSGCMLITCPNGEEMVNGLRSIGIDAAIIGRATGKEVRSTEGEIIDPPDADELYKVVK